MTIPEQTQWPTPTGEPVQQHKALELAGDLDRMFDQLDPVDDWRSIVDASGDTIRRQHALIVQMRDALGAVVQTAKFEKHAFRPWRNDADFALTAANDYLKQS